MGSVEDADGSIAIGNFNLKVLALQVSCFFVKLLPLPSPYLAMCLADLDHDVKATLLAQRLHREIGVAHSAAPISLAGFGLMEKLSHAACPRE